MKKIVSILFFIPLFAAAQKDITHTVAPKESLSSIGRKYNVNPRELAKYNKLDYDKGLSIGQVLKVPGKGKAVVAAEPEAPVKAAPKTEQVTIKPAPANTGNEEGQPIYHIVAPKETLYHISITNGKVPIADIKKWNHLTGDGVNEGTRLIIGYSKTAAPPAEMPVVKNEPVKETPVVTVPEKTEVKPVVKETVPVVKNDPPANRTINFNGGYFKSSYQGSNGNGEAVTASVFKSNNSGWSDGKYYCLHNTAPQGSIVKVTNTDGKSIYAKVLDVMPDLRQNNGLGILISSAAAAELGIGENKFDCTINYSR